VDVVAKEKDGTWHMAGLEQMTAVHAQ